MGTNSWLVVGVSGVTCSGKTTLADSLYKHFKDLRGKEIKTGIELNRVEIINQDKYFLEADDPRHVIVEKLNHQNWEVITSLDMDKMCNDIMEILGPKFVLHSTESSSVASQSYDNLFANHFDKDRCHPLKIKKYENSDYDNYLKISKHETVLNILIIEGFLIFNHTFTLDLCNVKFHLHLPYEKCYERRLQRIYDPPDVLGKYIIRINIRTGFKVIFHFSSGYFEMTVWPMYEINFREFKERKDIMILNGDVTKERCFNYALKCIMDEL
jgi:nicotinamide/nicotinate riboside kinase